MWRFTRIPKWNPQIFRHKMGPMYGDMFDRRYLLSHNPYEDHVLIDNGNSPVANLIDKKNHYLLEIPVPGFKREDLKIEVKEDTLTVSGKKEADDLNAPEYILLEHSFEHFSRSFLLGSQTDQENIQAKLDHGILYITLNHKKNVEEEEPGAHNVLIS